MAEINDLGNIDSALIGAKELDVAGLLKQQLREEAAKEIRETQALVKSLREFTQDKTEYAATRKAEFEALLTEPRQDAGVGIAEREAIGKAKRRSGRDVYPEAPAAEVRGGDTPLQLDELVLDLEGGREPYSRPEYLKPQATAEERRKNRRAYRKANPQEPTRDEISKEIQNDWVAQDAIQRWHLARSEQREREATEAKETKNDSRFKTEPEDKEATGQDFNFIEKKFGRPMTAGEAASYKPESQADKKKREQEQRKQEQEQRRAAREREEADRLWWASHENLADEALDTAAEGPISPGAGAASGSNMGRLAKRLKNAGGKIYNAIKGRRPGRKQFHAPRYGPGSKKATTGVGRAGIPKGVGGGKPPIPPVGTAGAAGAAGAGGAGAAGAGAAGAGGAGGAAMAAMGPVGIVVGLAVATAEATKAVYAFARAQEDTVRKLSQFGPQQAVAIAKLDVEREFRDMKTAQQTGSSSSDLTESISQFEDKLQPIESLLTNIANTIGARLMDVLGGMLEAVTPIVDVLTEILKALGGDDNTKNMTPWDDINRIQNQIDKDNQPKWPQRRDAGN